MTAQIVMEVSLVYFGRLGVLFLSLCVGLSTTSPRSSPGPLQS